MASSQGPLAGAVLAQLQKYPQLDPRAVLAIAAHEGLGGGIGDNGTSFGPFQLHEGGALPSGISNPQQWAWSPQGLDYALSRIAGVAGGLKGLPAIEAISTRFERPADPSSEIADAARHYGIPIQGGQGIQFGGGAAGTSSAGTGVAAAPDTRQAFARALLSAIGPTGQLDPAGLALAIAARRGG